MSTFEIVLTEEQVRFLLQEAKSRIASERARSRALKQQQDHVDAHNADYRKECWIEFESILKNAAPRAATRPAKESHNEQAQQT